MVLKPRYYQTQSVQDVKQAFKDGYKNIALSLCGGSGKSLIAKMILDMASEKGSKIGFFSYRSVLIQQIKSYKIPNCDIGTLQKYGKTPSELYDLVIIDESWGENSKLRNNINSKYTITLSGSPITPDGYALSNYDKIVEGIQFDDLIKAGFAKPIKILSCSKVDTSNLKKQGGDYSIKESFDLMSKSTITKDIIGNYKKYCLDKKVMLFAVNTNHAEQLKKEFIQNNIIADTIHSKKSDADILKRFDDGEIKVLISVSKLNVGYDNPSVNCIILARPTKSIPLLLQTIWRGTRINPLKKEDECLILDLANCIIDTQHPLQKLNLTKTKQEKHTKCPKCSSKMKLVNRKSIPIDELEYKIVSDYICDCGETLTIENYKIINITQCEECGNQFKPIGGLKLSQTADKLSFDLQCECGALKSHRSIILTQDELKEITLQNALENGATWEDVRTILLKCCKDDGYKWQYATRLIDTMQNKKLEPKQVIEKIKVIKARGDKISKLMFI